ncbi:antitoxin PaaA2 family protein [Pseudomonas sp. ZT5P21]
MQTIIDCVACEPLISHGLLLMTTETIDHSTLVKLVESGAVNAAHIFAKQGGWVVQVRHGSKLHSLTAQRSQQIRLFKRLETLVIYLQGIGISHFDVDTSDYDPLQVKTYSRPDRSEALKQAHEAAAYEEWFKKQVQASIDDPRPSVSDEEVRRIFAAKRDAIRQRAR